MKTLPLIIVAVAALSFVSCKKKEEEKAASPKAAPKAAKANPGAMKPGKPATKAAPAAAKSGPVKLPSFDIANMWGGKCTPKDYLGKPAIVEVWSLTCPHCRTQAKYLEELGEKLDFSKYAIVSIHAMGGESKKEDVAKHFKNKKIQVCLDNGSFIKSLRTLPKKYQVRGIPHLFMVKANGEISEVLRGARPAATLKEKLEALK